MSSAKSNQNNHKKALANVLSDAQSQSQRKTDEKSNSASSAQPTVARDFLNGYYDETSPWTQNPAWQKERQIAQSLRQAIDPKKQAELFKNLGKQVPQQLKKNNPKLFANLAPQFGTLFGKSWDDLCDTKQIQQDAKAFLSAQEAASKTPTEPTSKKNVAPATTKDFMNRCRQTLASASESDFKQIYQQTCYPIWMMADMGRIMGSYLPEEIVKDINAYLKYDLSIEVFEKNTQATEDQKRHFGDVGAEFECLKDKQNLDSLQKLVRLAIADAEKSLASPNLSKPFKQPKPSKPATKNGMDPAENHVNENDDFLAQQEDINDIENAVVFDNHERQSNLQRVFRRLYRLLMAICQRAIPLMGTQRQLQLLVVTFVMIFVWEIMRSTFGEYFALNMMSANHTNTNANFTNAFGMQWRGGFDMFEESGRVNLRQDGYEWINLCFYISWSIMNIVPLVTNFISAIRQGNINRYSMVGYSALILSSVGASAFNLAGYTGAFTAIPGLDEVRFRKNISDMLAVAVYLGGRFITEHFVIYRTRSGGGTFATALTNSVMYAADETIVCLFMSGGVSDIALNRVPAAWVLYRAIANFLGELVYNWLTDNTNLFGTGNGSGLEVYPARNARENARALVQQNSRRPRQINNRAERAADNALIAYSGVRWFVHSLRWCVFNTVFSFGTANILYVATTQRMENNWLNFFILGGVAGVYIGAEVFFINLLDVEALTEARRVAQRERQEQTRRNIQNEGRQGTEMQILVPRSPGQAQQQEDQQSLYDNVNPAKKA